RRNLRSSRPNYAAGSAGHWRHSQRAASMSTNRTRYVATTLADVHAEPSFISELLTQLTNGVELEIVEEREKWCLVRQRDGYEGWAYRRYLVDSPPIQPTHITHTTVTVFAQPHPHCGDALARIPIGTSLQVFETSDRSSHIRACSGNLVPDGWVS